MSIKPSSDSGIGDFKRYFTLRKPSNNRFSLMPEVGPKNKYSLIGTFRRSLNNTEKGPSINWTQTLGRSKGSKRSPNTLEEAKILFSGDYSNDLGTSIPEENHLHSKKVGISLGTLQRNMRIFRMFEKKPEEINKRLEEARESFKLSELKESKKTFKKLLASKSQKPEILLYLAAIYLLENKGNKAQEYLKEITDPYLQILMSKHAEHISNLEKKDTSFSETCFYEGLSKSASEDEKIVAKKLLESFKENTPPQNIQ